MPFRYPVTPFRPFSLRRADDLRAAYAPAGMRWNGVRLGLVAVFLLITVDARAQGAEQRVSSWLASQPISVPRIQDTPQGTLQLMDVVHGRPRWYQTHNHRAMATIRVDGLHAPSPTGWGLDGSEETIGLWDASGVRRSHVELAGRVVQRDRPWHYFNHATHVAGTMVAAGVRPEARGAAPAATLNAWDWNNDTAEMAAWAAEGGLVSNHSYGLTAGWVFNALGDGYWVWQGDPSVDPEEDYRFGFYDDLAAAWDALAAAAPYYMILKSAGNEALQAGPARGEPYHVLDDGTWRLVDTPRPPDGGSDGFDTLVDASVAKNVLTVGAVRDIAHRDRSLEDIRLLDGSSRGPTDDGRIKPDVVASGELVLSGMTWGDDAYGTSSGTSHASPAVAGLAGLLQSLHRRTFGVPMTSASMKGLLIHTADEAGPAPGPDYGFGWGLVNAERAARVVTEERLHEAVLSDGAEAAWDLVLEDGEPLHATLAWTDPVGTTVQDPWEHPDPPTPVLNDRTPRLVNDLDLRITSPTGEDLLPWVLDPDRPAEAAAFGDNRVDVVEQVSRTGLPAGTYRVSVRHKGVLTGGSQAFSLLLGTGLDNRPTGDLTMLSGRVHTGGAGLDDVLVRLVPTAPVLGPSGERQTRTGRDGTFLLDDMPVGNWTLHVEDAGTSLVTAEVVLPSGRPVDIVVPPAFRLDSFALLRSPDLLAAGESETGRWETTAVAGGIYGLSLTFEERIPHGLASARVVLDTDSAVPYMGVQADAWLSTSVDWPLAPSWGPYWSKRVPLIWISGHAAPGSTVRIPWRILHPYRNLVLAADTLVIPVSGADDQAPLVRTHPRKTGLGYVPPGGRLDVETLIWDGSPVTSATGVLVDARDPGVEWGRMDMADNGVLGTHGDLSFRDGIWTGRFRPTAEADYRLLLEAIDQSGNRTEVLTNGVYSSRMFSHTSDVAVWTTAWFAVPTADVWRDLGLAGIVFDGWDTFMRGGPPEDRFDEHRVLLWMPSPDDLASALNRATVERLMSAGTHVVLVLSSAPPAAGRDWIATMFGVDIVPHSGEDTAGDSPPFSGLSGSLEGWQGRPATLPALALGLRPGSPAAPEPLVETDSDVFVVQSGAHVVTTLVPAPDVLPGSAHRAGYVSRLLHAASGLPSVVPEARAPGRVTLSVQDAQAIASWSSHPFATYEVELSDGDGMPLASATTPDTVWTVARAEGDPVPVSARVRARTPAGYSPWASSALATRTRPDPLPRPPATVGTAWPSPSSGRFRIPVTLATPGDIAVAAYRVDGRRVALLPATTHPAGNSHVDVDLTDQAPGIYLLRVATPTGHVHRTVIVTR